MIEIKTLNKQLTTKMLNTLIDIDQKILQRFGNLFSSESWDENNFLLDLPGKWELSFIALFDDRPIGFCICSLLDDDKCYIYRIAVSEEYKGRNIGKQMLFTLFKKCIERGVKKVVLEVNKENTLALGFYNKLKFRIIEKDDLLDYLVKREKLDTSHIVSNYFAENGYAEEKFVLEKVL